MLLGIVLHSAACYMTVPTEPRFFPMQETEKAFAFDILVFLIHAFRMPLFFLMAGLFARMTMERRGWQGFLRQRMVRLGVPLMLFLPPLLLLTRHYALAMGVPPDDLVFHFSVFWFLYFLLVFTLVVAVLVAAGLPAGVLDGVFAKIWFSLWRWPLLIAVTGCLLWTQYAGTLEPESTLTPHWAIPTTYALFYLTGWQLFPHRESVSQWERYAGRYLVVAAILLFPYLGCIDELVKAYNREATPLIRASWSIPEPIHTVAAMLGAGLVWCLIFGITGLFVRYGSRPTQTGAYLAGAAYWVYLTHFFAVLVLCNALRTSSMPVFAKFAIVLAGATAFAFGTYELLVRRRPWAWLFGAASSTATAVAGSESASSLLRAR